ncbi:phosphatidylglycerophosphatase A [Pseudidiomarina taiwanensis]|uniref:Phosphatidylglycerophosphatase A n=1 Tax=Pseudidiomarina taiwanensis TaxID=337250 RepID=A0A432ZCG0_9GAMM|nr:phosphatidylglycerophosphatase A [Pseudidiomarina taiwanensis]RUO75657.1 phosphatidylglycerophosphatase A [Pseudidiomarina taiwanensis]
MKVNSVPVTLLLNPIHFLSLGMGSGLLPKAPGTWGTLLAIPLTWLLAVNLSSSIYGVVMVFAAALGVWFCAHTAKRLGVHDHPAIVWDEICGYGLIFIWVEPSLLTASIGFALFRWLDIQKPWVIGWCDRKLTGGLGIMADDLVAGLVAGGVLLGLQETLDLLL